MKLSGIFYVEFAWSRNISGAGLVVIDDGVVNGGDAMYLYQGKLVQYGGEVRATINVKHYRGDVDSVMGPLKRFTLKLSGTSTDSQFVLEGTTDSVPDAVIKMMGKKVAEIHR